MTRPTPQVIFRLILICLAVLIIIFNFTIWKPEPKPAQKAPFPPPAPENYQSLYHPSEIILKHLWQADKKQHYLEGSIPIDGTCIDRHVTSKVSEDKNEILLFFDTTPGKSDECARLLPTMNWRVWVGGNENATFKAQFNWNDVPVTIIEIENETTGEAG
ncbi:OadG family protein [Candidatus Uhrbacteria bacterium]|nr:OadG family protein [Candidatus Uhrbacteria bacterium]